VIVVDANVIAYLLIAGESTAVAQAVWDLDSDWRVPALWRHEVLNVLSTYVKVGGSSLEQAQEIWSTATRLLASGESEIDMNRALGLAVEHGLSAYDAQYLALALALGVPLVTEDRRLREILPRETLSMQGFCDLADS
jgi:predicted nucleic acid-binding protein